MNTPTVVPMNRPSLLVQMASAYSMDADKFAATIRQTCIPNNASNEDFAAFLMVAHKHGLNPVTREIYAFPKKGGGIQPIVGIDGWMTLINSHPQFDGLEFEDAFEGDELKSITCRVYRKDRTRAVSVTEYMDECRRDTDPWRKWPARMLRHKAAIQAARYAFSFSGIIDPDEAERSPAVITGHYVVAPPPPDHVSATGHAEQSASEDAEPDLQPIPLIEPDAYDGTIEDLRSRLVNAPDLEILGEVWDEAQSVWEDIMEPDQAELMNTYNERFAAMDEGDG